MPRFGPEWKPEHKATVAAVSILLLMVTLSRSGLKPADFAPVKPGSVPGSAGSPPVSGSGVGQKARAPAHGLWFESPCWGSVSDGSRTNDKPAFIEAPGSICLGVLVNEGPQTVFDVVRSWNTSGLLSVADELIAVLDGPITAEWNAQARRFLQPLGFRIIEKAEKVIYRGILELSQACSDGSHFLFLEDDWKIAPGVSAEHVGSEIRRARALLDTGRVHGVRLRHAVNFGEPNHKMTTFKRTGGGKSFYANPCPECYILAEAAEKPPRKPHVKGGPECMVWESSEGMYCFRSSAFDPYYREVGGHPRKYVPYTNNPMLWRRDVVEPVLEDALPHSHGRGLEGWINGDSELWGTYPGYVLCRGTGLFMHARQDRGRGGGVLRNLLDSVPLRRQAQP